MQIKKISYTESQSIMTNPKESKKMIVSVEMEINESDDLQDAIANLKEFVRSELTKSVNEAKAKIKAK